MTVLSTCQAKLHHQLGSSQRNLDEVIESILQANRDHPGIFSDLLYVLGNISLENDEAREYFQRLATHRAGMEQALQHPVDLRVALMDFFFHVHPRYESPKIIEFKEYEQNLAMAMQDELTGLMNRRSMETLLHNELARSLRHGSPLSIIFLDIDNFKDINDCHGHHVGDLVLQGFADFLRSQIRGEDMAGRWGGEEFVLALPCTGPEGAIKLARRLLRNIGKHSFVQGLPVTFSAGIACHPDEARRVDELVELADARMYQAKRNGRNQVCTTSAALEGMLAGSNRDRK